MKSKYNKPEIKISLFSKENIVTNSSIEAYMAMTGGENRISSGNITVVKKLIEFQ